MGKLAKNTASTTKDNARTQHREQNNREIQERKTTENKDRAHNNRIDTGSTGKAILITPYFALRDTKRYTDR